MNELIESIFEGFTVDGETIPVNYMHYMGHGEPYVVYMQVFADNVLRGDDDLVGYADYYDFDVYSKGNFENIVEQVKSLLKENGFVWQPSRSSRDMFEVDTGYYHKTLNFSYLREESE
jgi:hypothetical protein